MAAPPTELSILTNFLLPPAPLPALISLKTFTALFPHSRRSSPAIRALYRNLQTLRLQTIDKLNDNIIKETKRGSQQRRAVAKARREEKNDSLGDEEIELEESIFGPSSNLPITKPHTLSSIIPELNMAAEDLSDEIQLLEEEENRILNEMRDIVVGLSDLRYGKLENSNLRNQVVQGCLRIENLCNENQSR